MDPMSAVSSAQEIAGICLSIAKKVKAIIEAIKGAKQALSEMIRRLERMRLILNEFKSLAQRLAFSPQHNITLAFNDSQCKGTLNQIEALIHTVAKEVSVHRYWMQANWIFHEKEASMLLGKLAEHEADLGTVLQFIAADSSVTTEHEMKMLRDKVESRSVLVDPFAVGRVEASAQSESQSELEATAADPASTMISSKSVDHDIVSSIEQETSSLTTEATGQPRHWLVCTALDAYDDTKYTRQRTKLSNAAWAGNWKVVLSIIELAAVQFGEEWANAPRLKRQSELEGQSMWTPLHQAAYMGASADDVRRLLALGASRTNRTRVSDRFLPYDDLTAFDIAGALGYTELLDLLIPKVRHYLPPEVILALQGQLQALVRQLLGDDMQTLSIRLPDLSVLLELEEPLLEFILPKNHDLGKMSIYLDGRELLLRYFTDKDGDSQEALYRLTTSGWIQIQDALSLQ